MGQGAGLGEHALRGGWGRGRGWVGRPSEHGCMEGRVWQGERLDREAARKGLVLGAEEMPV